jgi:hypothetical protein
MRLRARRARACTDQRRRCRGVLGADLQFGQWRDSLNGVSERLEVMNRLSWLVGMLLALSGCAERYGIRPTQLSELNDDQTTTNEIRLKLNLETSSGQRGASSHCRRCDP